MLSAAALRAITSPAGQGSVATFTPKFLGHHLVVMRRDDGGAVCLPFFVEMTV